MIKEEKLKNLMNRISLALKDATLQEGFEIICKRIAELKKENVGLKENALVWHKVTDGDYPPYEKCDYSINVLTDRGYIAYYNYDEECWVAVPSSAEIDTPVAWCEIPKFKEN